MAFDFASSGLLVLDACCLLNLYATGRIETILRALRTTRFAASQVVVNESLYVLTADGTGREALDLQPIITADLFQVMHLSANEMTSFVNFAALLEDGEAMTCALALHNGGAVATDERKVFRVMQTRVPYVKICTTTEIIRAWANAERVDRSILVEVLTNIRVRGRFAPGPHDPQRAWWQSILDRA